jgi:hypothetical protein
MKNLLKSMLHPDKKERPTAKKILKDPIFSDTPGKHVPLFDILQSHGCSATASHLEAFLFTKIQYKCIGWALIRPCEVET